MRWCLLSALVFFGCDDDPTPSGGPVSDTAPLDLDASAADAEAPDEGVEVDAEPDQAVADQAVDLGPDAEILPGELGLLAERIAPGRQASAAWIAARPAAAWYEAEAGTLNFALAVRDVPRGSAHWVRQVVDDAGDVGRNPVLFELEGRPAIAYYDAGQGALKFAYARSEAPEPGDWDVHVVDEAGNAGQFVSVKVGPVLRMAWYAAAEGELRYGETARIPSSAADWRVEVVDAEGDVGQFAALDLADVEGRPEPRVAYYDATNTRLKWAARGEGGWVSEVVEEGGDLGRDAAIALGGTLIAYRDEEQRWLKAAWRREGVWETEYVDQVGDVGRGAQIHTHFGAPLITHGSALDGRIKQAFRTRDGWRLAGLDAETEVGGGVYFAPAPCGEADDLGIGRFTGIYLYRDANSMALRFTYDAREREGAWYHHAVGSPGGTSAAARVPGETPALVYSAAGRVYYSQAREHPILESGHWVRHAIGAGRAQSMVAGRVGGQPATLWVDGGLHFAQANGGRPVSGDDWSISELELEGDYAPAGLVDLEGAAFAAFDRAEAQLRYGRLSEGAWLVHVVDARPDTGASASLFVHDERPYIVYEGPADEEGRRRIQLARGLIPKPGSSSDWTVQDVGFALDPEVRLTGASGAVVEGRPALLMDAGGLLFARGRNADPQGEPSWVRHTVDGSGATGTPMLGVFGATPTLLYAGTDEALRLWNATTGIENPGGRPAWTFSRLDERATANHWMAPVSAWSARELNHAAWITDGCLNYAWRAGD